MSDDAAWHEDGARYHTEKKYKQFLENPATKRSALFKLRQELAVVERDYRKDTRKFQTMDVIANRLVEKANDIEDAIDAGTIDEAHGRPIVNKIDKRLRYYDEQYTYLTGIIKDDEAYIKVIKEYLQKYGN